MPSGTRHDSKLRMVESVLRWAWDPIGVRGIPRTTDEYNEYAPAVLDLLDRWATDRTVADRLSGIVRERMKLGPAPDRDAAVAALLRELHAVMF